MTQDPEMHGREMDDIEARTTPGTDPRVEELRGEQEMRDSEPRDPAQARPEPGGYGTAGTASTMGLGLDEYRTRFADAQSRFIDDPKGAVEEARSVVEQAVDRLMESVRSDAGGTDDTEQMRVAMRRYRDLFDRLAEATR